MSGCRPVVVISRADTAQVSFNSIAMARALVQEGPCPIVKAMEEASSWVLGGGTPYVLGFQVIASKEEESLEVLRAWLSTDMSRLYSVTTRLRDLRR